MLTIGMNSNPDTRLTFLPVPSIAIPGVYELWMKKKEFSIDIFHWFIQCCGAGRFFRLNRLRGEIKFAASAPIK